MGILRDLVLLSAYLCRYRYVAVCVSARSVGDVVTILIFCLFSVAVSKANNAMKLYRCAARRLYERLGLPSVCYVKRAPISAPVMQVL